MIRFPCICGQVYEVPEDQAGNSFQCTRCGRLVDVPPLNDLAHIQADGTYDIDETDLPKPESAKLDEMMIAYSREKVDQFGNEKDLRNTEADYAGLGAPEVLEFADDGQPVGVRHVAPKYDPVTGELIRELDVKQTAPRAADADAVPVAKAMIAYARHRPGEAPFRASQIIPAMLTAPNMIVVLVIFIAHVFLQVMNIAAMLIFFIVPAMLIFAGLIFAHYAVVVNDIATEEKDELPRPLRDFSWHDDLWGPFCHFFVSLALSYGPLIALNWMPDNPVLLVSYAVAALCFGTAVFPALFLTTTTSGHWFNLSPDRVLRVIGSLRFKYVLCIILWAVAAVSYAIGIGGTSFAIRTLFMLPGAAPINPWLVVVIAYPLLVVGIFIMHVFCWYLGLQYREHHAQFGWLYQSHYGKPPEPRSKQGFYVGPTAETPDARRARIRAVKPTRAIPVQPQPPPPLPPQR